MMNKLAKAQKSWVSKSILILTALSFMSLFGVSGYIVSAGKNKPVIKVDDITISQAQFAQMFDHEQQMARNLFGDNMEINDNIRNAMLQGLVQRELTNAVMERTAEKYNVSISDGLVRKIIYSQAEFMDAGGNFSLEKLRRVLSASGWTEQKYIDALKRDIIKQQLIQNPVANMNVPQVMLEKAAQIENQKRVFKYIKVDPAKVKIDRQISDEEIEQYYQDFSTNFTAPEKRDVSFIVLSFDDIAAQIRPDDAEAEAYYKENISQFETPETRDVLQMVFDSKEEADKADAALKEGKDFYAVAESLAKQDKEATDLGYVAKDMLLADLAEDVFSAPKGGIVGPVKSEMGWHLMKVANIKAGSKADKSKAKEQIVQILKKEKAYNDAYEITAAIEDKAGSGTSLEDIAKELNVRIYKVSGLGEDGNAGKAPEAFKNLTKSPDFIDTAFSYNTGEISQMIETDDGFAALRVDNIIDAHPLAIDQVKGDIEKLWEINERSAIAQEIVNDVMHDLENGDNITDTAARFSLKLNTSKPIKRSENFEGLTTMNMIELFQENEGTPKLINQDDVKIIAVTDKIIKSQTKLSEAQTDTIKRAVKLDLTQDMANQLVDSFSRDYDVRVKYRLLGLAD